MKNKFQHNPDGTTYIFLESKNKDFPGKHIIIIDTEAWDRVKEYAWCVAGAPHHRYPYVITHTPHPDGGWYYYTRKKVDGSPYTAKRRRRTMTYLHHMVIGKPQKGVQVDHINHNGRDNRKENLRFVTASQNNYNSRSKRNTSSQYKGVSRSKHHKKWKTAIRHKGKYFHLGFYSCEHQAACAFDKKAIELRGVYTFLNFPEKLEEYLKKIKQYTPVAQLVEQAAHNRPVVGSSPTGSTS